MGRFPPSLAGPEQRGRGGVRGEEGGGGKRRANIDWTLLVALESPQQMFSFGRSLCPVFFKLLHHSLEVKGPRIERVF